MEENRLILVTGGARSGKSSFAEVLAEQSDGRLTYLATAQILDGEMQERVRLHRERRSDRWITREAPFNTALALQEAGMITPVILLDCLTLFITNQLLREFPADEEPADMTKCASIVLEKVKILVETAKSVPGKVIVVTNEVGLGIVPDNALSRTFRDLAGQANQYLAMAADEVYFLVSGLPVRLKPAPLAPRKVPGVD